MSAKKKRKRKSPDKYARDLEAFIQGYVAETGDHQWTRMKVAEWAIDKGLWKQRRISAIHQLAAELGNVMRHATITNEEGHEIRKYCAYRLGDDQPWLWKEMSQMTTPEYRESATSRREKLAGGVIRLTLDSEHFDKHYNTSGEPVYIDPDFTKDIAEFRQSSLYDDIPPDDDDDDDDDGKKKKD